jgi:hypothetical protein
MFIFKGPLSPVSGEKKTILGHNNDLTATSPTFLDLPLEPGTKIQLFGQFELGTRKEPTPNRRISFYQILFNWNEIKN